MSPLEKRLRELGVRLWQVLRERGTAEQKNYAWCSTLYDFMDKSLWHVGICEMGKDGAIVKIKNTIIRESLEDALKSACLYAISSQWNTD